MHISYQPLWDTLKERGMRKEDLRLAAGLTTNMIANMGKGEHISMKTLLRICGALHCDIADVFLQAIFRLHDGDYLPALFCWEYH